VPFDGRNYTSSGLVGPYHAHPEAPMTPRVLSGALRGSYFFGRHHAKLVGVQTYKMFHDIPTRFHTQAMTFNQSTWTELTVMRRNVSEQWTHMVAQIRFAATFSTSRAGWRANHRIVVDNGAKTATGETVTTEIGLMPNMWHSTQPQNFNQSSRAGLAINLFDPAQGISIPEFVAVADIGTGDVTITVEGYCDDAGSNAVRYWPHMITVWAVSAEV